MTINAETYEAEYLELAGRPGMEALWRWCSRCLNRESGLLRKGDCDTCQNRGWLPLYEAHRMAALVRVALGLECNISLAQRRNGKTVCELHRQERPFDDDILEDGPTPEAALTRALVSATDARVGHG